MAIDQNQLLGHVFPEIRHDYVERDAILYALGIGLGADPIELDYLLETRLKLLPTFAVTLASPGMWVRDPGLGIDFARLLHSAQAATFLKPLPPRGAVIGRARIASLADRGAGKGAVLVVERTLSDAASGEVYCILQQTLLLRGDGGYGGAPPAREDRPPWPAREPDHRVRIPVSPRAALIYRLSGDWNPLHADPEVARQAGFERPILHGYASYGMAGWAIIRTCAASAPAMLRSLAARFSGVVYPGDRLDISIWVEDERALFQAHVGGRLVLDQGEAGLET